MSYHSSPMQCLNYVCQYIYIYIYVSTYVSMRALIYVCPSLSICWLHTYVANFKIMLRFIFIFKYIFNFDENEYFQVLYFKDFSVSPISQSSVKALTSIDWKSYGLTFRGVVDQGGFALLEWENLPPYIRIHISLHHYHNQYPKLCWMLNFLDIG